MRVLLVEDDPIIADSLVLGLGMESFAVDWANTKAKAETALKTNEYSLLVLDIGLPDGSGLDILSQLRNHNNDIPVLILTAYDETVQKIKGLDKGADDYLVKPFDLDELLARIRAVLRRTAGHGSPIYILGNIQMDPASHKVTVDGIEVTFGPKEFAILRVLMEQPNRIFSKFQIEESLYGWNMEIESNAVEVHIHGIRKKIGKNCIQTIRHVGYKMSDSVHV